MRSPPTYSQHNERDKYLIAEQPGRVVLLSGLILASVIGLSIRGLTAPTKIKSLIEAATSHIHKDVKVEFESAQISLSHGLFPRFAVVISNVKMDSSNECWMTPRLRADEIRLPLSFFALLHGESPITEIEGGKVQVDLRTAYRNCEAKASEEAPSSPAIQQFVKLKNSQRSGETDKREPQVEAIRIDELEITAPHVEPLNFQNFAIRVKSFSPRVVEVSAKTQLFRDEQVGDYLSHMSVWAEYTEFPKKSVSSVISGNWREGSYELKGHYLLEEEDLNAQMDLKHIPLSQVMQVMKRFQWVKEETNSRQVWLSLHAQLNSPKVVLANTDLRLRDVLLEGDLGEMHLDEAHMVSLSPVRYFPFTVELHRLNLGKLLSLLKKKHPSSALGELGAFEGTAQVRDADHIDISGVHRGLEFIFANKGQREVQTLKEFQGHFQLDHGKWTALISQVQPDQGVFDGQLQAEADSELKNIDLKAKASEVRFAPSVIKLMTAGGSLGPLAAEVHTKLEDGKMSLLKGTLSADSADVEGVSFTKLKMNFDANKGSDLVTQAQVQRLQIQVHSPSFEILKDLIEPEWMIDNHLDIKNFSAQFRGGDNKSFNWKNVTAQFAAANGGRLNSDGGWNDDGLLSGQVTFQSSKGAKHWLLGGQRDEPVFTLADTTRRKLK